MTARQLRSHLHESLECIIKATLAGSLDSHPLARNVDDIRFFCKRFVLDIDTSAISLSSYTPLRKVTSLGYGTTFMTCLTDEQAKRSTDIDRNSNLFIDTKLRFAKILILPVF
jgi:hypothetical protein